MDRIIREETAQLAEHERVLALTAQVADRQRALDLAIQQLERKEQALATLEALISEREQSIQVLSTQLEDKDTTHALSAAAGKDVSDALLTSARLVEAEETSQRLALQLAETKKKYTALLTQQKNVIEVISAQLEMRQSQLDKITGTLGWRLLSRYGRLKYRYLLPIYRLLGLRQPQVKKAVVSEVRENFSVPVIAVPELEHLSSVPQSVRAKIEETEPVQPVTQPSAYDVVIFPIIDWAFRFQRPQQLATQFAENGHRVFYLGTTFHQGGAAAHALGVAEGIFEVQIPGPAHLNIYRDEISKRLLNDLINAMDLFRRRNMIEEAVCVVQLPFWTPLAIAAKERWGWKIVYDCMDDHAGFTTNNATMLQHEETLVAQSDLVVTTSRKLYDKLAPVSRRILALPNATDFDHFRQPGPLRPLSKLKGPIIGYYGAVSDWFDVEMVCTAAEARPDWQFVLVGDTFGANVSSIKRLANVHLPGEQPYAAIPSYLHQFDVAIIPFLLTPLTESTNPVKFYEYLSAGKPVVAVGLRELEPYRDYFYAVRSHEEFVTQIETALREDSPEKIQGRMDFARQHTWLDRYKALSAGIGQL